MNRQLLWLGGGCLCCLVSGLIFRYAEAFVVAVGHAVKRYPVLRYLPILGFAIFFVAGGIDDLQSGKRAAGWFGIVAGLGLIAAAPVVIQKQPVPDFEAYLRSDDCRARRMMLGWTTLVAGVLMLFMSLIDRSP